MVSADQLLQVDVRLRQAKQRADRLFGDLAMILSGDFLQLPPVDKDGSRKSLATNADLDMDDTYEPELTNKTLKRRTAKRAETCLLYTSPSPRDLSTSRMPSSA